MWLAFRKLLLISYQFTPVSVILKLGGKLNTYLIYFIITFTKYSMKNHAFFLDLVIGVSSEIIAQ